MNTKKLLSGGITALIIAFVMISQVVISQEKPKNNNSANPLSLPGSVKEIQVEDFETGNFQLFPWYFQGPNWTITGVTPYEGNYSARSGVISNYETSAMKLAMLVEESGDISFHYKVSSENMFDFLRFYIDNTLVASWSGEIAWSMATFPVQAGTHVFSWEYVKDGSVNHGDDCAWVDYITFPGDQASVFADFTAYPTIVCENEQVQFTDISTGNISSWQWQFPGGTPAYSTVQNPQVTYGTAGQYDVTLTVSNGAQSNTITKSDYILVETCTGGDYLVIDLDPNTNSGPVIRNTLEDIGILAEYTTVFPQNIDQYSGIFVCLGTYPQNYTLSGPEGTILEGYLLGGGNLYMEGSDTWYFDQPTAVHPLFNIYSDFDGTSGPELGLIYGLPGTFAENMTFNFNGDNMFTDHLNPLNEAFLLLRNETPQFGTAIAFEGNGYHTIGCSMEFGGLAFGPTPVNSLMQEIIAFFNNQGGTTTAVEDFETGDFTKFDWQFSGMADWNIDAANPYEGTYCAKSGQIEDDDFSSLIITLHAEQADTISFYSSVSSETFYDKLTFRMDGNILETWSGEVGWGFHSYPVAEGTHTFEWRYEKDHSVQMGSDCAWVDFITMPGENTPPPPVVSEDFETANFEKFDWMQGGDADWVIDNQVFYGGSYSARSGVIGDAQTSELSLTLNILEQGHISFYKKVSSENAFDKLIFYIDNLVIDTWSGEVGWGEETFMVAPGQHTFKWAYEKDFVIAMGDDCAWIDDITFPPFEAPCPPVIADFDWMVSISDPLTYYFTNTSQGDISLYEWEFGDGSGSFLENPAHTFAAGGIYNVCLTVVNACNGQTDMYCEQITVEDPCPPCQAAFSFVQDPANPYHFYFNDASAGEIDTWNWNFGDGNTSGLQFTEHTFNNPGTYNVCLTVESACSNCTSTLCQEITITVNNLYNLGGTVFAGDYPIDEGFAYLYKMEDGQIVDVFASFIHEYGYYDFFQLEEGTYILKAEISPNSPLYNLYIPTYYVSVPNWVNASIINLQSNIWNADVHMVPISGATIGTGLIAGQVQKSEYEFFGDEGPVGNIEIILMDQENNLFTFTFSDQEGFFEFPQLAYGTYKVYAELIGKTSVPAIVTISESNPVVENICFIIAGDQITLSVPEQNNSLFEFTGTVYPNPATEYIRVQTSSREPQTINLSVIDQDGRRVISEEIDLSTGLNTLQTGTLQLKPGMYTLKLTGENGSFITRKFIRIQ